jgi:hypothetical protein
MGKKYIVWNPTTGTALSGIRGQTRSEAYKIRKYLLGEKHNKAFSKYFGLRTKENTKVGLLRGY